MQAVDAGGIRIRRRRASEAKALARRGVDAGLVCHVVRHCELRRGGGEGCGLGVRSARRAGAAVVEEASACFGEFLFRRHVAVADADVQCGCYVEVHLAEDRVLLDVVVVVDRPDQVVGPEIRVELRGSDAGIGHGVGVDVMTVDALEGRTEAGRGLVVQVRPLLVGGEHAGHPFHTRRTGRRGQPQFLRPGIEVIVEHHRGDDVTQNVVVLGLVIAVWRSRWIEEERRDRGGVEVGTVRQAQDAPIDVAADARQVRESQPLLHGQAGHEQRVPIRSGDLVELLVEADRRNEGRGVVRFHLLVKNGGSDREIIGDVPQALDVESQALAGVHAGFQQRTCGCGARGQRAGQGVTVDITAVVAVLRRHAQPKHTVDDGNIQYAAGVVIAAAVLGVSAFNPRPAAIFMGIGLRRDEADRASLGACAVEGALRSAQNFDPIDVDQPRLGVAFIAGNGDDRNFVDVDADGRIADGRAHSADGDVVLPGSVRAVVVRGERYARHDAGDVFEILNMQRGQRLSVHDAHADWHVFRVLFALVRGDDDFRQCRAVVGRSRHRIGVGNTNSTGGVGAPCRGSKRAANPQ